MNGRLVCAQNVVWRPRPEGGAFVVDTASGEFAFLNSTACEFVSYVRQGLDVEAIGARFAAKYDVPAATLREDLEALARELVEQRILEEGAS